MPSEDQKIVRTVPTGDKIFLIQEGKRFWIKNPETLRELGYDFGQEQVIEPKELYGYEDGGALDVLKGNTVPEKPGEKQPVTEENIKTPILNYRKSV